MCHGLLHQWVVALAEPRIGKRERALLRASTSLASFSRLTGGHLIIDRTSWWWRTRRTARASARLPAKQNFRVSGVDGGARCAAWFERELPRSCCRCRAPLGLVSRWRRWLRERAAASHHHGYGCNRHRRPRGWLESGADDYIRNPSSHARCWHDKSVLRRVQVPRQSSARECAWPFVLDLDTARAPASWRWQREALTASEFDLLRGFAENPNRPQSGLASGGDLPPRDGGLRPLHRPAHRAYPPHIEGDPAHPTAIRTVPRRRLHVRAAED